MRNGYRVYACVVHAYIQSVIAFGADASMAGRGVVYTNVMNERTARVRHLRWASAK